MSNRLHRGESHPQPARAPRDLERVSRRRRTARRTAAVLPTLFTLGNLLSGFFSVFFASRTAETELPFHWTPLTFAAIFVFIGMVMDGLDGRIARLTRNTSDLGAQLDSMADMVTFGVAPAFMAVQLVGVRMPFFGLGEASHDVFFDRVALVIAGIYVACAALRLARFNLELHKPSEADHSSFKGLPSPGAAGTVASLVLLHQHFIARYYRNLATNEQLPIPWSIQLSAVAMIAVMLLVAFAMVSRQRYLHLANRYLRGRMGIRKLAYIVIAGLFMAVRPQESLAIGFTGYAMSAPALWLWGLLTGRPVVNAASPAPETHEGASPPPQGADDPGRKD